VVREIEVVVGDDALRDHQVVRLVAGRRVLAVGRKRPHKQKRDKCDDFVHTGSLTLTRCLSGSPCSLAKGRSLNRSWHVYAPHKPSKGLASQPGSALQDWMAKYCATGTKPLARRPTGSQVIRSRIGCKVTGGVCDQVPATLARRVGASRLRPAHHSQLRPDR